MRPYKSTSFFTRFAKSTARAAGRPAAFLLATTVIVIWAVSGPAFGFSNTWQLVINSCTTIVTFLMVFLIQATQNRDAEAMHLKLDELIRCLEGAHNALLDLEEMEEKDLDKVREDYRELAKSAREALRHGHPDTGRTELKNKWRSRARH